MSAGGRPKPCLIVSDVSRRYGSRCALEPVSLTVHPGEILAVLGPNGAGKTTLLSLIAGIRKPTTGSIDYAGKEPGWVPQQVAVYRKLSVVENLRFFARLERVADVERAVEHALGEIGLSDRANDSVGELSGGNQQRVNVAAGLMGRPPLLLLDEPTSGLDVQQKGKFWELLRGRVSGGTSIVLSTHSVTEADRNVDRILILVNGRHVFMGCPDRMRKAIGIGGDSGSLGRDADIEQAYADFLLKAEGRS